MNKWNPVRNSLIGIAINSTIVPALLERIAPQWLEALARTAEDGGYATGEPTACRVQRVLAQFDDPDSKIVWTSEPIIAANKLVQTSSFVVAVGDQYESALLTESFSTDGSRIVNHLVELGEMLLPTFELARDMAMANEAGLHCSYI